MSDLMMTIISSLYHAPDYTDNAKHIADTLSMEYRALNAAVGWAGNKIRDRYESGAFFEEPARTAEKKKVPPAVEAEKEFTLTAEEAVPGKLCRKWSRGSISLTGKKMSMARIFGY